ncbi:MAG: hypothetical protein SGPRY_001341, partial [Prymnesium sp.]
MLRFARWLLLCSAGALLEGGAALHMRPLRPSLSQQGISMAAPSDSPLQGGVRLLEWIPSQKGLVKVARLTWNTVWKSMVCELAPQSPDGEYVRPAPQMGSAASWPDNLPVVKGRYHLYIGNACPWCHRVGVAARLRNQLLAKSGQQQPSQF